MTVHIDTVKPFLSEVPKSWLADDIEEPSERADNEQTLVKASINEPNSEQLISEPKPEEESVSRIDYEVDSARPLERLRREVRAPKYSDEYGRPVAANKQRSC